MWWLLLLLPALASGQNPCGIPLNQKNGKVVGGEDAARGAWPWQASLQWAVSLGSNNWNHYCGGSILSNDFAITAAHCVVGLGPAERVVFGQLESDNWTGDEVVRTFTSNDLIIHEGYVGFVPYEYDVALIRLNPPVDLAQYPQLAPACLPSDDNNDFVDHDCMITGWGYTESFSSGPVATHLQQGEVDVISNEECLQDGPGIDDETDTNICIFDREGEDTISCSGDSGGPLNCLVNGRYEMAGTSSWGFAGCPTNVPRVYHRTTYVIDWIRDNTGL